ncbi:MAG: RNA-binding protein [Candidatus Pacebacteria bacterium CG10_big_fil_rev_8_21_14_0_10_44_54]|nr:MAG: RNA-binding protein [Candidatus Pacebacteria bacterium CG10_big_fil_rev_8_21_14_0_10_44_54]
MSDQYDQQENKAKLFIGNLPWSVTEDQLRELLSQYGELKADGGIAIITDHMSGRPKGFAFAEFTTAEAAAAAVEGLNGFELEGRALVVNIARPRAPRPAGGGYGGGGGYNRDNRGGGGYNNRDNRGGGGYGRDR